MDESLPLPPRFHDDIDDDDFQPLPKSRKPAADAGVGMSRKPNLMGTNVEGKKNVRPGNAGLGSKVIAVDELMLEKMGKLKLPKIYFGSRTYVPHFLLSTVDHVTIIHPNANYPSFFLSCQTATALFKI